MRTPHLPMAAATCTCECGGDNSTVRVRVRAQVYAERVTDLYPENQPEICVFMRVLTVRTAQGFSAPTPSFYLQ
jgi:hypothetical protein